jgi:PDZ domain-containing secreted protein
MATTIVNPAPNNNSSDNNGMGFLVGAIVLIVFVVLFFVYALPYIRGMSGGGVQVNVPKSINVNVKQSK